MNVLPDYGDYVSSDIRWSIHEETVQGLGLLEWRPDGILRDRNRKYPDRLQSLDQPLGASLMLKLNPDELRQISERKLMTSSIGHREVLRTTHKSAVR